MGKFVHLHTHTEYSLLDGIARVDKICKKCKEKGMDALAITDHGNMFGILNFAQTALNTGIKPIIGCEMYMCDDHLQKVRGYDHLILLCKNSTGYKNLVKLDSIAYVDGFYYKPRASYELLKQYKEGLICLSGCLQGRVNRQIVQGNYEGAKKTALMLKEMFGEDFYIELQDHGIADEKRSIPDLIKLAKELDIKLVATNDIHYIEKDDYEIQDVALCIGEKTVLSDQNRKMRAYKNTYLKTPEEMEELFSYVPEAISNSVEIANKCDDNVLGFTKTEEKKDDGSVKVSYNVFKDKTLMPGYVPPNGQTPEEYLRALTENGLKERYDVITEEVNARKEHELGIIHKAGFDEYFLIVWDFVNFARTNGISVGIGRGSGVGSIVAYAVGITDVDPLKYSLFFERFLNLERVSMPDFDIDFADDRREEVVEYVRRKYGTERVAQIVTFGTLATKAAIKDVARVYSVDFGTVNTVTKLLNPAYTIRQNLGFDLVKTDDSETPINVGVRELIEIYNSNDTMKKVMDAASKLEGLPRNTSKHAAGVVICAKPIADNVPLQRNGEDVTTQFDKNLVEAVGLLKMDFLGLITLTDLQKAYDYIEQRHGVKIDFKKLGYDDLDVYKYISSGETMAVFQLEQPGMTRFMGELKPTRLEDLIAGISLYRPGPMDSIPKYIESKNNPDKITYKHEVLKPILKDTYGCIVYQEQVMKIVQVIGGFSLGGADGVRRTMSKKKVKEMEKTRIEFLAGAKKNGYSEELAISLFDEMESFARYAFNKSHATAYAVLSYQTAYVKLHYHNEFMTAILNNRINKIEEIAKYLSYLKSKNVPIYQPDVNKSKKAFSCEGDGVRVGLSALKNVGEGAVENIIKEREQNGEFASFEDFVKRTLNAGINKRMVESLILAGAFDSFGHFRSQLMAIYSQVIDNAERENSRGVNGQLSLFGTLIESNFGAEVTYPDIKEFDSKTKLTHEKSVLGVYVSGHPLSDYRDIFAKLSFNTGLLDYYEETPDEERIYTEIKDGQKVTVCGIITKGERKVLKNGGTVMYALELEDLQGSIECVFYNNAYDKCRDVLVDNEIVKISGRLRIKDKFVTLIGDNAEKMKTQSVEQAEQPISKEYLLIDVPEEHLDKQDAILDVLTGYPGDLEVIINFNGSKKKPSCKVRNCEAIMLELISILGKDRVRVWRR